MSVEAMGPRRQNRKGRSKVQYDERTQPQYRGFARLCKQNPHRALDEIDIVNAEAKRATSVARKTALIDIVDDMAAIYAEHTAPANETMVQMIRESGHRHYGRAAKIVAPVCAARQRRAAPRSRGAGRPRRSATRSSARSGDSPDDSDGPSHQPPHRAGHAQEPWLGQRCESCGRQLVWHCGELICCNRDCARWGLS
jgi:hypothetical protein